MIRVLAVLLTAVFAAGFSAPLSAEQANDADGAIVVTANRLQLELAENRAVFSGNVRVVRDDMTTTCDTLTLHFSESANTETPNPADSAPAAGEIERLIAEGNVEIIFSDMTAAADRAEYFSAKETLVLSGDKASVRRTEAVVTGSKITVLRGQERVRVEGSEQKQMEAVFYPQGDGFFPSTEK